MIHFFHVYIQFCQDSKVLVKLNQHLLKKNRISNVYKYTLKIIKLYILKIKLRLKIDNLSNW